MEPRIYLPSAALLPLVHCYWTLEGALGSMPQRNTIVPDGCIKLIFHYADPYVHWSAGGVSTMLPRAFVIGQLTKPYTVEPTGATGTFFVRFRPSGFLPFTSMSLKEMENRAVSLERMFGMEGRLLEHGILSASTTAERIALVEAFLSHHLAGTEAIDQVVGSTVNTIIARKGNLPIEVLSEQSAIGRRQLARKFGSSIGLSPKQLSRIVKLQGALKMHLNGTPVNLTELGYENAYYD